MRVSSYFTWIKGRPKMSVAEIAEYEEVNYKTMRGWFSRYKHNLPKIRNKLEEFKRKGRDSRQKLYPYRDGNSYTLVEIQKMESHLNIPLLRLRYRERANMGFDAIFAPKGVSVKKAGNKISKGMLAGLGPRRNLNSIRGPSEYEKQLWGETP